MYTETQVPCEPTAPQDYLFDLNDYLILRDAVSPSHVAPLNERLEEVFAAIPASVGRSSTAMARCGAGCAGAITAFDPGAPGNRSGCRTSLSAEFGVGGPAVLPPVI